MHMQIRTTPATSPADIEKLLRLFADAEPEINLVAAGGGDLELGGEFAFAVQHGQEDQALEILRKHRYPHRTLEVGIDPRLAFCEISNKPGELHKCIARVARENLEKGRIIRDVVIGAPTDAVYPVHVYSEEVRTTASMAADSDPS